MIKCSVTVARILVIAMLTALHGLANAQEAYPSKPIRFIIPFTPGGSTSVLARLIGQKLSESWGQQVIVDNRPGGNTIIGSEALVKSAPDGYTILQVTPFHVTNPHLFPKLPYDPIKDFAPVATLVVSEFVLVLNPGVPANDLRELIALAKSKPGQLNYASTGNGGATHLASEFFNIMAGVKVQHIPYKGTVPALTDVIGGQVQMLFAIPIIAIPHINSGKLKAIAISGEKRWSAIAQVPTFTEAGLPNFDVKAWYGVLAPAETPKEIVNKLSAEIARILALPDIKEKLLGQGMDPFVSTPEQFAALIKADLAKYARIIKAANIKIE